MPKQERMAPILSNAIERKREEIDRGVYEPTDNSSLRPHKSYEVRDFLRTLRESQAPVQLVALIQRGTPLPDDVDFRLGIEPTITEYERQGAAAVGIWADSEFGFALEDVPTVRGTSRSSLLAMDFVIDEAQVVGLRSRGADAILLITSMLPGNQLNDLYQSVIRKGMTPFVEVGNERDVSRALELNPAVIGIHNRDLHTMKIDLGITGRLINRVPEGVQVISEGGFKSGEDVRRVQATVKGRPLAVLAGTSILQNEDLEGVARKVQELTLMDGCHE